jgi:hypothetical protein
MRLTAYIGLFLLSVGIPADAWSQHSEKIRVDVGATFSRIEQQIKTEVGAVRGERLVEQTELGTEVAATYEFWGPLSAGIYGQADFGTRRAGRFDGFDEDGAATLTNQSGGPYQELWLGPLVRAQYRAAFAELGYGLLTFRNDKGRDDIASEMGDTTSAFRTLPTVSWRFAIGGNLRVSETLDVSAKLIWRIRYYDRRGGDPLADDAVHGTQSYQPFIGIVYRPGRGQLRVPQPSP